MTVSHKLVVDVRCRCPTLALTMTAWRESLPTLSAVCSICSLSPYFMLF